MRNLAFRQRRLEVLDSSVGYLGVVVHNLGENIVWEEGDFNWFKENRDKGARAAIKEREKRYAELGMDLDSAKRDAGIK